MAWVDLKLALRVLARRPLFTAISLFAIVFTLLVLVVAAALLEAVFGPHAPETRSARTLGVYVVEMRGPEGARSGPPGYGLLERYVKTLPGVENVTLFTVFRRVVSFVDGRRIESWLKRTDGAFFEVLEFSFLEGGPFTAEDDREGRFVAVINAATRERFFGRAPALGRDVVADGQRFRVVGVVRDVPLARVGPFADIWVPLTTDRSSDYRRELVGNAMALILARKPQDLDAIKAELATRLQQAELPDPRAFATLHGGAETTFEAASRVLFSERLEESHPRRLQALLFLAALAFMLLPAVNLVNVNLSRILERAPEIGVRKAFGASRLALTRQFLVENLVLTLVGALLALGLAAIVVAVLNRSGLLPYVELTLSPRVFLSGLGLALLFGFLSGVYPAFRMARLEPAQALRGRS